MRRRQKEVAAELSVKEKGYVGVGVEARDALRIRKDDKVEVELHSRAFEGNTLTVTGHINSGHEVKVGKEHTNKVFDEETSRLTKTVHVDGVVRKLPGNWYEDEADGPLDRRWDNCHTLDCEHR